VKYNRLARHLHVVRWVDAMVITVVERANGCKMKLFHDQRISENGCMKKENVRLDMSRGDVGGVG
jgi:hypothetical protein